MLENNQKDDKDNKYCSFLIIMMILFNFFTKKQSFFNDLILS